MSDFLFLFFLFFFFEGSVLFSFLFFRGRDDSIWLQKVHQVCMAKISVRPFAQSDRGDGAMIDKEGLVCEMI